MGKVVFTKAVYGYVHLYIHLNGWVYRICTDNSVDVHSPKEYDFFGYVS